MNPDNLAVFDEDKPLVIYSNHSSWWDPMVAIFLADKYGASRKHYAPIEDVMLERYGVFKKLGFYGIEKDTARGAKDFLNIGKHLFQQDDTTLWITPQGRFADCRERPLELKKGLAQLLASHQQINVLPLAIEYAFWTEKKPELLLSFAKPITITQSQDKNQLHQLLESSLEKEMDALSQKVIARNREAFENIVIGESGVGGIYGLIQKLRGYKPDHSDSMNT